MKPIDSFRSALALATILAVCSPAFADKFDDLRRAAVAINCREPGQRGGYIGSGMLIHKDGYILTSTTVVPAQAVDIRCHFAGALNRPARLVATDADLELSVIKVDASDLPEAAEVVTFRRGDNVKIGETVFSYGDGHASFVRSGTFTVSLGIVSGRYRTTRNVPPQPVYVGDVIETTATLAAGMDGGALFDSSGRVIGLLSLNVSELRWLGTAVPVDAFIGKLSEVVAEDAGAAAEGGADADRMLSIVDAKGPTRFALRDRINAEFADGARAIAGSMVSLDVDRKKDRAGRGRPMGRPPEAYQGILKRPDAPVTGWLISDRGHVLTTWFNVWGDLRGITVKLSDGQAVAAELLGVDEANDLALVRFNPEDLEAGTKLQPLQLSQAAWAPGMPVAVVGLSPGDSGHTLTCGIVSAGGRLDGAGVQLDAPLNYGSAGGAVIDLRGRCVGVAVHQRARSIWSQNSGVGMAVTAATVGNVLDRLKAGQTIPKPKRGYLGIRMSDGDLETRGVVIAEALPGTPAEDAGLQPDEVITAVDGEPIATSLDLARVISRAEPGTEVKLTVKRGDQKRTVTLILDEHPYR